MSHSFFFWANIRDGLVPKALIYFTRKQGAWRPASPQATWLSKEFISAFSFTFALLLYTVFSIETQQEQWGIILADFYVIE